VYALLLFFKSFRKIVSAGTGFQDIGMPGYAIARLVGFCKQNKKITLVLSSTW